MSVGLVIRFSVIAVAVVGLATAIMLNESPWSSGSAAQGNDTRTGCDGAVIADTASGEQLEELDATCGDVRTREDISSAQLDALADGEVTFGEYEASVEAMLACIEDAGGVIRHGPHPDATGKVLEYSVHLPNDPAAKEELRRAIDDCSWYHHRLVLSRYSASLRPDDTALSAAREALKACLVEGGVPEASLDEDRLSDAADDNSALFARCSEEVSEEFGLPNFGG